MIVIVYKLFFRLILITDSLLEAVQIKRYFLNNVFFFLRNNCDDYVAMIKKFSDSRTFVHYLKRFQSGEIIIVCTYINIYLRGIYNGIRKLDPAG